MTGKTLPRTPRQFLKALYDILPAPVKSLRRKLWILHSFSVDMRRFWRHSHGFYPLRTPRMAHAHMLRIAHALEKGLCLPAPRPGFGREKMEELLAFLGQSLPRWGVGRVERIAFATLDAVVAYHAGHGLDMAPFRERMAALVRQYPDLAAGGATGAGAHLMRKKDVLAALPPDPEAFFRTRRSVRMFAPRETFDYACLERAVRLAQQAPSVCNRQAGKAYIYTGEQDIARLLRYQNGNKGFGDTLAALVICTAALNSFFTTGERNQGYVDGGLFAMALVYAFHALGVGTCMLNWSQSASADRRFRKFCRIPENEVIITMIGVGPLRDEYEVAASPRRDLADAFHLDDRGLLAE